MRFRATRTCLSGRAATARRAAAALCAAALLVAGAGGLAAAPRRVSFRFAPTGARLYLDGRELPLRAEDNGIRSAALEPGARELLVFAERHAPRWVSLNVPAKGEIPLMEIKLEREYSRLALEGMGPTGRRPKSVYYTPDGRFLVLPLLSGTGADILDASSLDKMARLEPPPAMAKLEGFVECAFFPNLGEVWVSQMYNSLIHVFDLESFAYKESFTSGGLYPKVIAASPDGARAYVANWVGENVAIFDSATRKLLATVPTGGTPRGLAPSPNGTWLYIARFSDGAILRLRLDSLELGYLHRPDGGAKRHLVLDAARGRLYATDMHRNSLFAIDLVSGRVLAEIALGPNPNSCAVSPDGERIYACTRGPNGEYDYEYKGPVPGELFEIDARRLVVVDRQWGGNQPTGIAVSPDGSRVVFTDFLDHRVESYRVRVPYRGRPPEATLSP